MYRNRRKEKKTPKKLKTANTDFVSSHLLAGDFMVQFATSHLCDVCAKLRRYFAAYISFSNWETSNISKNCFSQVKENNELRAKMGKNARNPFRVLQSGFLLLDVEKNCAIHKLLTQYCGNWIDAQTLSYLLENPGEFTWNGKVTFGDAWQFFVLYSYFDYHVCVCAAIEWCTWAVGCVVLGLAVDVHRLHWVNASRNFALDLLCDGSCYQTRTNKNSNNNNKCVRY